MGESLSPLYNFCISVSYFNLCSVFYLRAKRRKLMEPLYHMVTSIPLKEVSQMGLILVLMVAALVIFHLPRPEKKGVDKERET